MAAVALDETFPQIDEAIRGGRMLDAWKLAESTGVPLQDWPDGDRLHQAARLAGFLGSGRLGRVLRWKNWRMRREDPGRYYHALHTRIHYTPPIRLLWETRTFLENAVNIADPDRADILSFQASVHVMLRDLENAGRLLDEALRLDPQSAWLRSERSAYLSASDRYAEALEEARVAVGLDPGYRPAVERCSEALIHLGKDDEALELLERTHEASQQAAFAITMQVIHSERGHFERGLWCLDELERLSPLMEPSLKKWLTGRRADFHLMGGDIEAFLATSGNETHRYRAGIAKNLRRPEAAKGRRQRLEVRFTRQHRMTCAPATLASLAAYWEVEKDHLEIADAICYEGTPWHKERQWAEDNGFVAREFRLTRTSLVELIDRGIPFTLTTEWTTGAHLQACIGYDTRTDTAILRDPTERHFGERLMEELISSHPINGPRGMVLVPADRAELLSGLRLEDEHVYDSFHRLLVALETKDRYKVQVSVTELRAVAPDHPLALEGEMRAAYLFQNWVRALALTETLIGRFPKHQAFWLTKCGLLTNLRRSRDLRTFLEEIVARPGADAVFRSDLGELLAEDARELVMADHHLRRALKDGGNEARVYENLARCRTKQRRFDEAAELRRAASCLAPAHEPYAAAYFRSCRMIGKADLGLDYLRQRTLRLGKKDRGSWLTHAGMLEALNRQAEAAEVLERAGAEHPDDGEFLLRAGHLMIPWGPEYRKKGQEWMERARGRVLDTLWLRESAEAAAYLGDRKAAIRHWRSLQTLLPHDISVWRSLVYLVAEETGREEAVLLLDEGTTRFPDSAELWALAAEWLATDPRGPIPALDRYLELMPSSAWGYRERALRRLDKGEYEKALEDTSVALELEPEDPSSPNCHARVLSCLQRRGEAADMFRLTLSMDIDRGDAAQELMELAVDREESLRSINFIEEEMRRQVSCGDIVPVFQRLAWRWMEPEELLEKLRGFCQERPDLWQTWSARITHALRMSLPEDALEAARSMTRAFPLLPRAWMDLARVHQAMGNTSEEVAATGKALEISPTWDETARAHADALERNGDLKEAEQLLRNAVDSAPLAPANRGCLADLIRRTGRKEESVDVLMTALRGSPFYAWGWGQLANWMRKDGRIDEAVDFLRSVSQSNQHRSVWWSTAADAWMDMGKPEDAVLAVRKGLDACPDDKELRDKLAWMLCESGQVEEAVSLCEPREGEASVSRELEGRRAWILMKSGQPVRAIEAMRTLLDREPDYVWGLGELTEWLAHRKDWKGAREIATRWSRYAPLSHIALGYIGQAEECLDHPEDAMKAYAKAMVLSPDYDYAGRRLLDLHIKAGRYGEAMETLGHLRHYTPSIWLECDAVELELKRGNHDEALNLAGTILDRRDAGFDELQWVGKLFNDAGKEYFWSKLVDTRLAAGTAAAPGTLAVSIGQISTDVFAKVAYKRIKSHPLGSSLRVEGWKRMLDLASKLNLKSAIVKWTARDAKELRDNDRLWKEVGGAFLTLQEYERGADWMRDWKERTTGVDTQSLSWVAALNDGCRNQKISPRQAAEDARMEGLRRFPDSNNSSLFRAGLAFRAAVDGRMAEAKAWLQDFEPETTTDYYANYGKLARAVVAAADGDEASAKSNLRQAILFFAGVHEKAAKILGDEAIHAVAGNIPSARGSARRLRKQWGLPALGKVKGSGGSASTRSFDLPAIGAPGVMIAVFVLINLLRACAPE